MTLRSLDNHTPNPFAVYYGWPSALRNRDRLLHGGKFRLAIIGAGLEKPEHPDHSGALELIADLQARGIAAFGYLGLAAKAPADRPPDLEASIERMSHMAVDGVFLDDCGGEHGVSQATRQRGVSACHAAGLAVVVNAGDPSEALFGIPLDGGDGYMIEGFGLAEGHDSSGFTLSAKCKEARRYRDRLGINLLGIATLPPGSGEDAASVGGDPTIERLWDAAAREQLDYFLVADPLFGAAGPHKDRISALPRPGRP